jgi:hypothetical protein
MRVSQVFRYKGPFPWQCCHCIVPVRPGELAFRIEDGGRILMSHDLDGHFRMDDLEAALVRGWLLDWP